MTHKKVDDQVETMTAADGLAVSENEILVKKAMGLCRDNLRPVEKPVDTEPRTTLNTPQFHPPMNGGR